MKEVIAIIRPERWPAMQLKLEELDLPEPTQHRVLGRGREQGLRYLAREGAAQGGGVRYLPKRMLSWVIEEQQVPPLIEAIVETNRTGTMGDGKLFVLPVEQSVPIGTEEGDLAELLTGSPSQRPRGDFPTFSSERGGNRCVQETTR